MIPQYFVHLQRHVHVYTHIHSKRRCIEDAKVNDNLYFEMYGQNIYFNFFII